MNEPTEITPQRIAQFLLDMSNKPQQFNRIALGRPPYWSRQAEIAQAVNTYKNVIVATGNSVGKSYLAAGLILWWLFTRPNSLVIATAPSQTLLGTVLFKEIRNAFAMSQSKGMGLRAKITDSPRASPQIIEITPTWGVLGIATRGVERLSGQHNPNLMVMIDEASGVLPEIWEALTSLNPNKLIAFGNPLEYGSHFHKFYQRGLEEANTPNQQRTVSIRIPSLESPDIQLPRSPRGLADQGFLLEAERQWGRGTPLWQSHVEGHFPDTAAHGLLESHWVERAFELGLQQRPPVLRGRCVMAIDPAAGVGADRTAIVIRDYYGIVEMFASPQMKMPETALCIDKLSRRYAIPDHQIIFDAGGLGRDLARELEIHQLGGCCAYYGAASGGSQYLNQRAACAWRLRDRLDPDRRILLEKPDPENFINYMEETMYEDYENLRLPWPWTRRLPPQPQPTKPQDPFIIPPLPDGESLRQELLGLRYQSKGLKISLEAKEQMSKRLGRSPDLADALIMSFAIQDN